MTPIQPQSLAPWFASTQPMAPPAEEDTPVPSKSAELLLSPSSPPTSSGHSAIMPTTRLPFTGPSLSSGDGGGDEGEVSPSKLSPFPHRLQKGKPRGLSLLIPDRPAPQIIAETRATTSSSQGATPVDAELQLLSPSPSTLSSGQVMSLASASATSSPTGRGGFAARRNKKPAPILLSPPSTHAQHSGSSHRGHSNVIGGHNSDAFSLLNATKSAPNSPSFHQYKGSSTTGADGEDGEEDQAGTVQARKELASTLRGAPRKRPSLIFSQRQSQVIASAVPVASNNLPAAWRDPSEHILTGAGSTLQHARSVYAAGPIEVLPGVFLGDEHNACDEEMLMQLGITTILNVAKETVLPFQFNDTATPLLRGPGPHISLPSPASPTESGRQGIHTQPPAGLSVHTSSEMLLSACSPQLLFLPNSSGAESSTSSSGGRSPLRPHTSTPNLKRAYKEVTATPTVAVNEVETAPSPSSDDGFTDTDPASSDEPERRRSGTRTSADADASSSSTPEPTAEIDVEMEDCGSDEGDMLALNSRHPSLPYSGSARPHSAIMDLPPSSTVLYIPGSEETGDPDGRVNALRYIKFPWTHDEVDLASKDGGFRHGCAVIAEALGLAVDARGLLLPGLGGGAAAQQPSGSGGKVLVHCQCGVSRSATLVIAFVMQAAALGYGFEATKTLQGMHDCYNLVKEASSSISPNCSLIYQLVEWERVLSVQAQKLRSRDISGPHSQGQRSVGMPNSGGWTADVMGEEEWLRMRAEEERKEAEEALAKEERAQAKLKGIPAKEEKAKKETSTSSSTSQPLAPPSPLPLQQENVQPSSPSSAVQILNQFSSSKPPPKLVAAPPKRNKAQPKVPQLLLKGGARARIEQAQSGDMSLAPLSNILPHLTIDRSEDDDEDEDDEGEDNIVKGKEVRQQIPPALPSAAPTRLNFGGRELVPPLSSLPKADSYIASQAEMVLPPVTPAPPVATAGHEHVSQIQPVLPAIRRINCLDSPKPKLSSSNSFGAQGQSLAERRNKHKRTFSTDWPTLPVGSLKE
ncbi:phosphatases II [Tilletiaria anomala UBC 951]|uniref:protein-tyrosine-phosphatase n=1 Tax=Tilletiaria anomala (strain ATCC 24038 / CBS 436.72 / UBC 951) TaxID=1037660 RepID=A0A066W5D0_TILAU|nr:phosphatases II [Tilletiaria anomala UBC 951]KDN47748.1 phosphatases II [Tilletiaria anomala UBC 951]